MSSGNVCLPCPFCGNNVNPPELTEYIGDSYKPYWWIECTNCDLVMSVDGETSTAILEKWNRRSLKL